MIRVMLVGNPNCGKTTLFNALTGENQRVGNWPGVTVEKKSGQFVVETEHVELIDLPGLYSLTLPQQGTGQDEFITVKAVTSDGVDVFVNVLDACQLERHLYLTSQLLELDKPLIIALNMTDIAKQRGIHIDVIRLSEQLGCPVIPIQAHKKTGMPALKQAIRQVPGLTAKPLVLSLPPDLLHVRTALIEHWVNQGAYSPAKALFAASRLLEGDAWIQVDANPASPLPEDADIYMADARYQAIHQIMQQVQKKNSDASEHLTAKIDRVVLHRFWAIPIFLSIMYAMFFAAINVGGAFQDFFDISSDAIFVQGAAHLLHALHVPNWSIAFIAEGVGKGINTTLTFIPVIAAMFFFLALLETSGYMARAAFVVDRVMRALGLPGKSFVPMIVGFGCNVPAIMAARTLDSERDRLLTILMSPFMSCSARLAIYAIFVSTFFPTGGQNVVFSLYLVGILMAVVTGLLLRKTVLSGRSSPLLLELPAYHKPSLPRLLKEMMMRLRYFILRAGKLIIPVCVVLGGLNALTLGQGSVSVLSQFGQWLTPVFSPLGIHQDNWPATLGLLTGMLAKEVVVGTLHSLYSQVGHVTQAVEPGFEFWGAIQTAFHSIPENLYALTQTVLHPYAHNLKAIAITSAVSATMYKQFDGAVGAYAYLLFVLLYIPCVSTMAVIRQEAGRRLMWFSVVWSLMLAYGISVGFYQTATVLLHPTDTFLWVGGILASMGLMIWMMQQLLLKSRIGYAIGTS
jgi:ferrous iron transport protein B